MCEYLQKNVLNKHWSRPGVPASEVADYLCLSSGHNELAERLAEFVRTRYDYKIDVVGLHSLVTQTDI